MMAYTLAPSPSLHRFVVVYRVRVFSMQAMARFTVVMAMEWVAWC